MPIESTQHLYNLLGPQSWEEMRPYTNEKFIPAPLTPYSADRLTAISLVWIRNISEETCMVCSRALHPSYSMASGDQNDQKEFHGRGQMLGSRLITDLDLLCE